jgi:hypothetical protein
MYCFSLLWNLPFRDLVFGLDDPGLINYLSGPDSFVDKTVLNFGANRWRPISNLSYVLAFEVAGFNYNQWWLILNLVNAGISTLILKVVYDKTHSKLCSIIAALLALTSRQTHYLATQATGLMEGIGIFLFILIISQIIKIYIHLERVEKSDFFKLIAFSATLILVHERYQLIVPALIALVYFAKGPTAFSKVKIVFLILSPVFLVGLVKQLNQIPMLVGTGSSTELGFTINNARNFSAVFMSNSIGINYGEPYLFGASAFNQTPWVFFISLLTSAVLFSVIFNLLIVKNQTTLDSSKFMIFFTLSALIFSGIMLPAISTIRIEPRWILAGSLCFYIVFSIVLNQLKRVTGSLFVYIGLLFLTVNLVLNHYYKVNSSGTYFIASQIANREIVETFAPVWNNSNVREFGIVIVDARENMDHNAPINLIVTANTGYDSRLISTISSFDELPAAPNVGSIFSFDEGAGKFILVSQ